MPDYGLDIAIPFTGDPDPSLPWADDDDALLVPGSLLLFDAAHSANPVIGVPAAGADLPNIAWKRARDVLGAAVFTGRIDNGTIGQAGTVLTVTAIAAGQIVIGQQIAGTGVNAGQTITGQTSGAAGREGVYTISNAQSVAATTITATAGDIVSLSLYREGQADTAGVQVTERSGKGGLHSIQTQTNGVVNVGTGIRAKGQIESFLAANNGHQYYYSRWERVTRVAATLGAGPSEAMIGSSTNNYLFYFQPASNPNSFGPPDIVGGARRGYFFDPTQPNTPGNRFQALSWQGATGTIPSASAGYQTRLSQHGMIAPWQSSTAFLNNAASRIVYRLYLEDLTVSGRTYAQVQAADYALYQAAFAAGGRYAGDTFTAPNI